MRSFAQLTAGARCAATRHPPENHNRSSQPPPRAQAERRKAHLAELHGALEDAARALGLRDAVRLTGALLINRIPRDAPAPVSPARVTGLAAERGCSERTIRSHIQVLVDAGLAANRCLDGGRRRCLRGLGGQLHEVYGIDLSPLIERRGEMARRAAALAADRLERDKLRYEISRFRRVIRMILAEGGASEDQREAWASLPRRVAHLGLAALAALMERVGRLHCSLTEGAQAEEPPANDPQGRKFGAARPEENCRPYTTHQNSSEGCNPPMAAMRTGEPEPEGASIATRCGLGHVTLRMAYQAAPEDWRASMEEHYGRPSWHALVGTAYERAQALGVSPATWAQAQAVLGQTGAAILILIADAGSAERGGPIRSVGGWVRRMSERAETGQAHLHRSVFGLLHRGAVA